VVATLTGERFGGTNAASRLVYLAVGAAAAAEAAALVKQPQGLSVPTPSVRKDGEGRGSC
jgi:hypothetical protein